MLKTLAAFVLAIGSTVAFAQSIDANQIKPAVLPMSARGIKCDGVSDDTAVIQAGINAASAAHRTLALPAGTCNITAALQIPLTQHMRFKGQSKLGTTIRQMTDNTPILVASNSLTHSIEIDHMTLAWNNQQTTSDPLSFGIEWTGTAGESYFRWHVHDIQITNPYVGMGILSSGSQAQTVWNCTFEDILIARAAHSGVQLVPAVAAGMPVNVFTNLSVNNTGGGPTPDGPAVNLRAVEAILIGLDVEGWKDDIVSSQGGGYVNIIGVHVENGTLSASGRMFFIANAPMHIDGGNLSVPGTIALTSAQIVNVTSGGNAELHNIVVTITPSGGTGLFWSTTGIAKSLDFLNLTDITGFIGLPSMAAINTWPDVYPLLRQNQTAPQLVQMGSTNGSSAGYCMQLGPDAFSPGTVCYRNASSNNWHVFWNYVDGSSVTHFQKCSDVAGSSAGPPTTAPTGCSDQMTVDASGNVTAGAYKIGSTTVIPSTATAAVGNTNGGIDLALTGTTGSIGGGALAAGACATGTATLGNNATGHPGTAAASDGSVQGNYVVNVSVSGLTATVSVCAITAGTPTAKTYNVTVF